MARLFIMLSLLKEAYDLDKLEARRRSLHLRRLSLLKSSNNSVQIYRLSEELIQKLEEELIPFLQTPKRNSSLSYKIKILCTLSFLATGTYQKLVGKNASTILSQPSTSRSIREVVNALTHPDFVKRYMRFPQNRNERLKLKQRFYEKFKIPDVIACIDGTFVCMVRPAKHEDWYYCRKGHYARNVQLITDADNNILNVDTSYGGATQDSFVFNYSVINSHLSQLTEAGETVYILGDSEYPQYAYLMTPVTAEGKTPESYYNKLHNTAHNTVTETVGLIKSRFRCLLTHKVLHYHPEMVGKIIIASCVLHNICNRAGLPAPTLEPGEVSEEARLDTLLRSRHIVDQPSQPELEAGTASRAELINRLWQSRNGEVEI